MNGEESNKARQSGADPENQRRLATLLSNLPGMAYRCRNDTDWTMEFVSDGCEALTGYKATNLAGGSARRYNSLVHPDDRGRVWNEVQEALQRGLPYRLTYRIRTADGREKWVWEQGVGIYSGTEVEALEGFITDITPQKTAEQARRQIEGQYKLISENTADVIWLWDLAEQRCVYVSPSVRQLRGFSPEEVMAQTVDQAMPPDAYCMVMAELQRRSAAVESGDEAARIRTNEIDFLRKDGTSVTTETVTKLISDERQPIRHVLGISRDITERKRAEDALRKSEEKFAKLFRSTPTVIMLSDVEDGGEVIDVSDAFEDATGYRREEVLGCAATGLPLWVDPREFESYVTHLRADGRTRNFEFQFRRKNGDIGTGLISGECIELDGKRCVICATIDITERKAAETAKARLEEELRQAQRLESVGRLAGGVAHDFNNLLTVINGYSGFLLKGLKAGDPLKSYADEIRTAGERAATLTKQLLAFSRKQVIKPRVCDLNTTIRHSAPMLQRLIGEDIALETHLDGSSGQVMTDPDQIHQVIMNLVVNARDAMPDGGKLEIVTTDVDLDAEKSAAIHTDAIPGRYVVMTVTDTGHGMDEATRQRIFEPFFTTKEKGRGTGLGLATVYGIVRQSNGWIGVSSEVGGGTSFKVYLPRIDEALVAEAEVDRAPTASGSETILVVEDQNAVRAFTKAVLEQYGYHVIEASGGEEAIDAAKRHSGRIHLLLTDVVLPGMNGKELSEQLKVLLPGLKVLFTSGYTADVIAHRGVLNRGVEFLHKPFNSEALVGKVQGILDGPTAPAAGS
jgi:PAS domain S-box-containing protein